MKKKCILIVICFFTTMCSLFADIRTITEFKTPLTMRVGRYSKNGSEYDYLVFTIFGYQSSECCYYYLLGPGFTDDEATQFLKKVRLELYDIGEYTSHSSATTNMESCLFSFIRKKYGDRYASQIDFEFEIQDISEEDGIRYYEYGLSLPPRE